jgi:hypothetical protein
MWSIIPRNTQIFIIVAISLISTWGLEGVNKYFHGSSVSIIHWISLVTTLISFVVIGVGSFSWRCLWKKFPWIARHTFPDLNGTWEGHLISTWVDPATGQTSPPIPTKIWIRQNLFTTSVKLKTDESISYSKHCLLEADHAAGCFRFWYSYDNTPDANVQYRSAKHEGVAWLELDIDISPIHLKGGYYTARKTSGDIDITRVSTHIKQ